MAEEEKDTIIERMKSRRIELGLSFQGLAERTGMSKSTLQRYESGNIKNVPLKQLSTLATGLRTTPEWLLGLDTAKESDEWYRFTSQLTPFDARLLNNFHRADVGTKNAVCKLLDVVVSDNNLDGPESYSNLVDWNGYE